MKKYAVLTALFLFLCATAPGIPNTQEEVRQGSVITKEVVPFIYVCVHRTGSFTQIQDAISQLMQELQNQNLSPMGGMLGIYYFNPQEEDPGDLEWDVGFPIPVQALVQMPLQKKQWTYTEVAATLHVGAYEQTASTYEKIFDWMDKNNLEQAGPIVELYLDMDPGSVRPENLKTEIWIPYRKK
ncbi:MAG: GyrI-like domain-containing protein [Candidatus Aminicenantes bacterium]|nr:GyrI-like domain-containing protein [Candidatus Aminicenantes bacterium]